MTFRDPVTGANTEYSVSHRLDAERRALHITLHYRPIPTRGKRAGRGHRISLCHRRLHPDEVAALVRRAGLKIVHVTSGAGTTEGRGRSRRDDAVLSRGSMKPHVVCHMMISLDGRIHPSRWTESPDGDRKAWTTVYEDVHGKLAGDAWLVGRVTMAEMSKGTPHPPANPGGVTRPHHFARRDAGSFAIAFDRDGKLHFRQADIGGDHVVVLLGPGVSDAHLAELAGDGISYVVAPDDAMDARPLLELLGRELGIKRLLVEGGGNVNGSLLQAGVVDELSLLIAPALDGARGITGLVEVPAATGLKGKLRLHLASSAALAHGVVHLRYMVEPT